MEILFNIHTKKNIHFKCTGIKSHTRICITTRANYLLDQDASNSLSPVECCIHYIVHPRELARENGDWDDNIQLVHRFYNPDSLHKWCLVIL